MILSKMGLKIFFKNFMKFMKLSKLKFFTLYIIVTSLSGGSRGTGYKIHSKNGNGKNNHGKKLKKKRPR